MKVVSTVLIGCVIIASLYFYMHREASLVDSTKVESSAISSNTKQNDRKEHTTSTLAVPKNGVYTYMGMKTNELEEILGKPTRVDPSAYQYDWWIYHQTPSTYLQIGILNNKVVSVYVIGEEVDIHPFYIGQSISEIQSKYEIESTVSLENGHNFYRFELTEEDMLTRPLVVIGDVYIQLYIDSYTKKLSSVRFIDEETLVKLRPYELVYRGELPQQQEISSDAWLAIEAGVSSQILDLTNIIRLRHQLQPVKWDSETAKVAYHHSQDMRMNEYFSHTSPTTGGLMDRLASGDILYQIAGENIAAKYVDGIAVVEGWLNSDGHRETLLNEDFTHLGVGVYERYYTQNFIKKFE